MAGYLTVKLRGGGMLAVPTTSVAILIIGRHADPCAALGFRDVGRGHTFRYVVPKPSSIRSAIGRRDVVPHVGGAVILRNAFATEVHVPEDGRVW